MLYVLYKNSGVHSGRALRRMLEGLYGEKVLGGYPKRFSLMQKRGIKPKVVVNLGVTDDDLKFPGRVLNTQNMVRLASNKRRARQIFEAADVPAPKLFTAANAITEADLPLVGRTSYHQKGEGFWFCKTMKDVRAAVTAGATHFLEFIPSTREYRVHTFISGKHLDTPVDKRTADSYVSTKISEKVWQGEGSPNPEEPQKNHEFGWSFLGPQDRRTDELDVVRYAAKQAIAALGIDFGAVDVMYRLRTKCPYVLEVNSTPSLADDAANTCEVYAKRILKTIGGKGEED
jgi:hypothetical protein